MKNNEKKKNLFQIWCKQNQNIETATIENTSGNSTIHLKAEKKNLSTSVYNT